MTQSAIVRYGIAMIVYHIAVMTAETTGSPGMSYMAGLGTPGNIHFRMNVSEIDFLQDGDCRINYQ